MLDKVETPRDQRADIRLLQQAKFGFAACTTAGDFGRILVDARSASAVNAQGSGSQGGLLV